MKCIKFAALIAAAALATPAMAQDASAIVGGVVAGFEAGSKQSFDLTIGSGGSSSSGYQFNVDLGKNSLAAFGSTGQASSFAQMNGFDVKTGSQHSGGFAGVTLGNATMDGQAMNFAQSNVGFDFEASAKSFSNIEGAFGVIGGAIDVNF